MQQRVQKMIPCRSVLSASSWETWLALVGLSKGWVHLVMRNSAPCFGHTCGIYEIGHSAQRWRSVSARIIAMASDERGLPWLCCEILLALIQHDANLTSVSSQDDILNKLCNLLINLSSAWPTRIGNATWRLYLLKYWSLLWAPFSDFILTLMIVLSVRLITLLIEPTYALLRFVYIKGITLKTYVARRFQKNALFVAYGLSLQVVMRCWILDNCQTSVISLALIFPPSRCPKYIILFLPKMPKWRMCGSLTVQRYLWSRDSNSQFPESSIILGPNIQKYGHAAFHILELQSKTAATIKSCVEQRPKLFNSWFFMPAFAHPRHQKRTHSLSINVND